MDNEIQSLVTQKFEPIVDLEKLPAEAQGKAREVSQTIDIANSQAILQYGLGAQSNISSFADTVLAQVRTTDSAYAGRILGDLLEKVRELDVEHISLGESFLSKLPLLGSMVDSVKKFLARYDKISDSLEKIIKELDSARMDLLKDIKLLDDMFARNMDYLKDLDVFIAAGQLKIGEIRETELPALQKQAQESGDPADAQRLRDLAQLLVRFEKKLHDLKLTRMVSLQSGPQLRLIQGGNQVLVEKIQSSLVNTIPLWKNQIVIAISLFRQKKALELQKEVTSTTNELLQKNSEMLKDGTLGIARESERGIVELDTLKKVNADLISTIQETLKIQAEGRDKRTQAERELVTMEGELKAQLMSLK